MNARRSQVQNVHWPLLIVYLDSEWLKEKNGLPLYLFAFLVCDLWRIMSSLHGRDGYSRGMDWGGDKYQTKVNFIWKRTVERLEKYKIREPIVGAKVKAASIIIKWRHVEFNTTETEATLECDIIEWKKWTSNSIEFRQILNSHHLIIIYNN